MFGVEVGNIPHGFGASNTAKGLHWHQQLAVTQDFSLLSLIWMDKVDANGMMTNPYPHPQHMKCAKHLSYVWSGGGNHSTWVWSLKHCTRAALASAASSDPGFQLTSPNLDGQGRRYRHDDQSISPSTAHEVCQTPFICLEWRWEPFHMGLEPQTLHKGCIGISS